MASTIISASGVSPQNAISTCKPFRPRIPLKCSRNCSLPLKYSGLRSPEKLLISRASGVYWLSIPSISFLRIRSICSRYKRPSGLSGTPFSTRCVTASGIRFSSRLQFGRARVIVETIDGIQRDFEAARAIGTPNLPCLVRVQFDSRRSGGWGIPYTGLPLHHHVHFRLVPRDFRRALFDRVNFVKECTPKISGNEAEVHVVVQWEASVWNPPSATSARIKLDADQTWKVRRSDRTGGLEVTLYTVNGLNYYPGSAKL